MNEPNKTWIKTSKYLLHTYGISFTTDKEAFGISIGVLDKSSCGEQSTPGLQKNHDR